MLNFATSVWAGAARCSIDLRSIEEAAVICMEPDELTDGQIRISLKKAEVRMNAALDTRRFDLAAVNYRTLEKLRLLAVTRGIWVQ